MIQNIDTNNVINRTKRIWREYCDINLDVPLVYKHISGITVKGHFVLLAPKLVSYILNGQQLSPEMSSHIENVVHHTLLNAPISAKTTYRRNDAKLVEITTVTGEIYKTRQFSIFDYHAILFVCATWLSIYIV